MREARNIRGFAMLNEKGIGLKTHNISADGGVIELDSPFPLMQGAKFTVHLETGFEARTKVSRVHHKNGRILIGLEFDREGTTGLPAN